MDIAFVISLLATGSCVKDALLYLDLEEPNTPSHDLGLIVFLYILAIVVGLVMRGYTTYQLVQNILNNSDSWYISLKNTMDNDFISTINDVGGFIEDFLGFTAALFLSQSLWVVPVTFVKGEDPIEFHMSLAVLNTNLSIYGLATSFIGIGARIFTKIFNCQCEDTRINMLKLLRFIVVSVYLVWLNYALNSMWVSVRPMDFNLYGITLYMYNMCIHL